MSPSPSIPDRKSPPPRRVRLDVEDDNARQRRIQGLLERTESSRCRASAGPSAPPLPPPDDERPRPLPRSLLISRAEDFLLRIAAANAALAAAADADPAAVNAEHLDDPAGPHIEMNLGLGVFTQRSGASGADDVDDVDEDDSGSDSADDEGSQSGVDSESDGSGDGTSTSSGSGASSSISSSSSSTSSSNSSSTRPRAARPPTTATKTPASPPSARQL